MAVATSRDMKRGLLFLLLLLLAVPQLGSCGGGALSHGEIRVHFLSVGQADCTLVMTRDATVLIDAGGEDEGAVRAMLAYLRRAGVSTIDCLILTHPHADHIGGATAVLEKFSVVRCLMPYAPSEEAAFSTLLAALREEGCTVEEALLGKRLTLSSLTLDFFSPGAYDFGSENDLSAAFRLSFGENSVLFTGDLSADAERLLVKRFGEGALTSQILKVGHHGSGGSTSPELLRAVSPTFAVISCGSHNVYGYPDPRVLIRLAEVGASVSRTDTEGAVVFSGNGESFARIE